MSAILLTCANCGESYTPADRPCSECEGFDADELVMWAQTYGHPEEWAKKAQAAHMRAEKAKAALEAERDRLREAENLLTAWISPRPMPPTVLVQDTRAFIASGSEGET